MSWSECKHIEKGDAVWGFVLVGLNLKHMELYNLLAGIWPLPVVLLFWEGLRSIKGLLITLTQDAGGVKVREGKWLFVICLFSYGTKRYHDTRLSASEQNRNRNDVPACCQLRSFEVVVFAFFSIKSLISYSHNCQIWFAVLSSLSLFIKCPRKASGEQRRGRYCFVLWVGLCVPDEGMWF